MDISAQPAKVRKETLLITTWVLFGAATAFFLSRLAIRAKFTGRLWLDDLLAGCALACLFTNAMIITYMADSMYKSLLLANLAAPKSKATLDKSFLTDTSNYGAPYLSTGFSPVMKRENIFDTVSYFMKLQFTVTILFWTCLWLVKASFLAFFHRLTNNLRNYVRAWWCITIFTGLAYIASMITYPLACSSFQPLACENKRSIRLSLFSLRLSTALDIISDIMIIALPMSLAARVKLPLRTKLALCGIFALGGFVIIMAAARIILTNNYLNKRPEVSWLNVWSAVESSTAVIVCNLAVFKFLFRGNAREYGSGPYNYGNGYPSKGNETSDRMTSTQRSGIYPRNSTSQMTNGRSTYPNRRGLQTHVSSIPPTERQPSALDHRFGDGIVVTREFDQMTAEDDSISEEPITTTPKSDPSSRTLYTHFTQNSPKEDNSPKPDHTPKSETTSSFNFKFKDEQVSKLDQHPKPNLKKRSSDEMILPPIRPAGRLYFNSSNPGSFASRS